ncbi:MAG: lysozyme inhibitor LprI family protein [Paracoccus sp. (in: a-proteobacteria)]|uniref:lysozyme inhibitor LprI family protein n=1 Tax=Paracoccus sp. TaxID=267 RepID=UPI0026DFF2A9|nr:lysozyme inhibitor LprI family protein [Paracoccus sp. (in: a-proteobacteria)]MDO5613938.1 lysozyme inhibitor LprI family protein [Paracoccus sp. (in: a-proteobacteria)]
MLRYAMIVAASLVALPAAAQDRPHYDPEILTACLGVREGDSRAACIGIASARCMDSSTAGMTECLAQETAQWDDMLNAAYQSMLDTAQADDAEMDRLGVDAAPTEPLLRDMQRAWMAYRDAACAYEASKWQGGTNAGPATQSCAMSLTGRQAIDLMAQADFQRAQAGNGE